MNKQELIETLEEIKANIDRNSETSDYTDFSRGRKDAYNNTIGLVKQLDEPKKVVVPKFVAEWIELYKKENKTTLWHVMNKIINEKFLNHQNIVIWFENDSNKHILEQAWVNGYEVEKEQLYYVFDTTTKQYLGVDKVLNKAFWLSSQNSGARTPLTEQEIKAIDERYWPFAVKVDGE